MLNQSQQNLKLYNDGSEWNVHGLTWSACNSPDSLLKGLESGRKHLVFAETQMNKASSRSHCVIRLKITKRPRYRDGESNLNRSGSGSAFDDEEVTQEVPEGTVA